MKMKGLNPVFAVCTLMLVGCQVLSPERMRSLEGFDAKFFRQPDPLFPNVFITSGANIVVDQEPIRIPKGDSPKVTLTWSLAQDSPYTFSGDGIEVDKKFKFDCGVLGKPRKVAACTFQRLPSGTQVKYTVRVKGGAKDPPVLDPMIMGE